MGAERYGLFKDKIIFSRVSFLLSFAKWPAFTLILS